MRISPSAVIVAVLVFLLGGINLLSAWIGIANARLLLLRTWLPLEVNHGSRTLTAFAGLMLMLLSWSLLRRKNQAWLAATILVALSIILHLMKGLDVEEALVSGAVLGVLLFTRRQFVVRSHARSFLNAVAMSVCIVIGSILYGVLGFSLLRTHFTPEYSTSLALRSTLLEISLSGSSEVQPKIIIPPPPRAVRPRRPGWRWLPQRKHRPARRLPYPDRDAVWFLDSLVGISYLGALLIAAALLRPVAAKLHVLDHEREEVRRLIVEFGGPPMAYWSLLPGLHYFFSAHRRAVIAYVVADNVAITQADPLGDPDAIPQLIADFAHYCLLNDWKPVWYQVTSRWLSEFRAHGWVGVKIGEDAVLDVQQVTFIGKSWQDVRTALHRLPREGYSAVWYDLTEDPADWVPALATISREWLARQHGEEKGFSLGRWDTAMRYAAEQRCLVLQDQDEMPAAFLTFVPVYGPEAGWSLDLMRRREVVPPGTMEFLLATALETFKEEGVEYLVLGLSPLADVTPEDAVQTPELLERIRELVIQHFSRIYNFHGLLRFKEKFHPRWVPRYLIYPSPSRLPKALIALMHAHEHPGKRLK